MKVIRRRRGETRHASFRFCFSVRCMGRMRLSVVHDRLLTSFKLICAPLIEIFYQKCDLIAM